MKVHGTVYNVSSSSTGIRVAVDPPLPKDAPYADRMSTIQLMFARGDDRFDILHKGDPIAAIGKIMSIGHRSLTLGDCELVET
jgi:hypothetical protein